MIDLYVNNYNSFFLPFEQKLIVSISKVEKDDLNLFSIKVLLNSAVEIISELIFRATKIGHMINTDCSVCWAS